MKNQAFRRISDTEKRRRLTAVLRHSTGGALDDTSIRRVLRRVEIQKQYKISVFRNRRTFEKAAESAGAKKKRAIYIYAPYRRGKGSKK
jgi:hypothetical protein